MASCIGVEIQIHGRGGGIAQVLRAVLEGSEHIRHQIAAFLRDGFDGGIQLPCSGIHAGAQDLVHTGEVLVGIILGGNDHSCIGVQVPDVGHDRLQIDGALVDLGQELLPLSEGRDTGPVIALQNLHAHHQQLHPAGIVGVSQNGHHVIGGDVGIVFCIVAFGNQLVQRVHHVVAAGGDGDDLGRGDCLIAAAVGDRRQQTAGSLTVDAQIGQVPTVGLGQKLGECGLALVQGSACSDAVAHGQIGIALSGENAGEQTHNQAQAEQQADDFFHFSSSFDKVVINDNTSLFITQSISHNRQKNVHIITLISEIFFIL